MTFSIIGIDKKQGEIGIAVFSKALAVGGIAPTVDFHRGAVLTQSYPNINYKEEGLSLMEKNTPEKTIQILTQKDKEKSIRQVIIMNPSGKCSGFTGERNVPFARHVVGKNCICAGNMLLNEKVVLKLKESFEKSKGDLTRKLISALKAAEKAGGDKRRGNLGSAAIIIEKKDRGVCGIGNRYIDLRIDLSNNAIRDLENILNARKKLENFFTKGFQRP